MPSQTISPFSNYWENNLENYRGNAFPLLPKIFVLGQCNDILTTYIPACLLLIRETLCNCRQLLCVQTLRLQLLLLLPAMGAWRKPGNFSGPGPGVERQRVHNWVVYNEIRGVLGGMTASFAYRILDSVNANTRIIRA